MSDWNPKPYQPHQSWGGAKTRAVKTALVVDDPKYHKYPPGKGPYPGNLSKSAYDAQRRATGTMGKGEAARYDHAVKIGKIMKDSEASRQKSLLTSQQSTVRQEKAAGRLGTKMRNLMINLNRHGKKGSK